ncbi:hypothetical protein D3C75_732530 [compost metagenome]
MVDDRIVPSNGGLSATGFKQGEAASHWGRYSFGSSCATGFGCLSPNHIGTCLWSDRKYYVYNMLSNATWHSSGRKCIDRAAYFQYTGLCFR